MQFYFISLLYLNIDAILLSTENFGVATGPMVSHAWTCTFSSCYFSLSICSYHSFVMAKVGQVKNSKNQTSPER